MRSRCWMADLYHHMHHISVNCGKMLLNRSLSAYDWRERFTYEELCIVLAQVEAYLNSQPIHPISFDPKDLDPFTFPEHFLTIGPITDITYSDVTDVKMNRLTRFQLLQSSNFGRDGNTIICSNNGPNGRTFSIVLKEENCHRCDRGWDPEPDDVTRVVSIRALAFSPCQWPSLHLTCRRFSARSRIADSADSSLATLKELNASGSRWAVYLQTFLQTANRQSFGKVSVKVLSVSMAAECW